MSQDVTIDECAYDGCTVATKLMRCSACKGVAYCSRQHQRLHWKTHKQQCKKEKKSSQRRRKPNQNDTKSSSSSSAEFASPAAARAAYQHSPQFSGEAADDEDAATADPFASASALPQGTKAANDDLMRRLAYKKVMGQTLTHSEEMTLKALAQDQLAAQRRRKSEDFFAMATYAGPPTHWLALLSGGRALVMLHGGALVAGIDLSCVSKEVQPTNQFVEDVLVHVLARRGTDSASGPQGPITGKTAWFGNTEQFMVMPGALSISMKEVPHLHVALWATGCPKTHAAVKKRLKDIDAQVKRGFADCYTPMAHSGATGSYRVVCPECNERFAPPPPDFPSF